MRFTELHEHIPLARYGKEKSLTMSPYNGVSLAMPGRHAEDTSPKGGDFCVIVTDKGVGWKNHQFKHDDIFNDIELKRESDNDMDELMSNYFDIITVGVDPKKVSCSVKYDGLDSMVFLCAIQCLAVAEHRRYHMHEDRHGGRFLPFRFSAGIAEGLWDASDAIKNQRYGRSAVERLEKAHGVPALTQRLFDAS